MSLTITHDPATAFELPPAGAHAARCCSVIDLGSQQTEWQGEMKLSAKLLLSFELAEMRTDGTPHRVSRRMTASLHEKAQLRAFLQQWRGRPFTDEELRAFNVGKLLNAPCLLNIGHVERAGRQYANILSVSPLPKGLAAPELAGAPVLFDLAAPDWQAFAGLSSRLQETIATSPEYAAAARTAPVPVGAPASAPPPAPANHAAPAHSARPAAEDYYGLGDDDIPF